MEHTIDCPKCGSPRVRMHNPESLCETAYPDTPHVFDAVATTQAICDDCGHKCGVEGKITWEQPRIKTKTLQYLVTVEVNANVDAKEYGGAIELAMDHSDNVASQRYSSKINLVVSES
jgi:C4-type Zn-finger protein